jgi:integrase
LRSYIDKHTIHLIGGTILFRVKHTLTRAQNRKHLLKLRTMWYTPHRKVVVELSFHDLRHDFAHRAREAGLTLEEVAYYLGHVTKKGTPAIQTTTR